jgi:light-regulated signal transduction histidine kinase (bacteriophytochrome)
MNQHWHPEEGLSVEESEFSLRNQLAQMEEVNQHLEENLLRQGEIESQLTQAIRELEIRNFEISTGRDQALTELHERERGELALRQKTEELARSNRDLEQFASLAAHDLQEPLHSIQVFLDLLRVKHGSSLNEQGQGYLNRVTKAASRMQQLIEGLLVYSRIDAPDSIGMSISLQEIVEEILSDLAAHIEELQAEIHVGDLPMIHGDTLQIRQLLQNLIGNALKFHKQGVAPIVHISGMMIQNRRHTVTGKPRSLCQIEIQDQGIGISAEHLDKIFGMFIRLHRKDEYEGTGIGLAVCQRIADQCGGAISARSILGEGSTFTVTLPALPDR